MNKFSIQEKEVPRDACEVCHQIPYLVSTHETIRVKNKQRKYSCGNIVWTKHVVDTYLCLCRANENVPLIIHSDYSPPKETQCI